jgi:CRP/FNR family transcriptional regulator, cyclic AMP receptor protein
MKPGQELAESLRRVSLFGGLSDKSLAGVAAEMNTYTFAEGDVVFEQDDSGRFGRLYVVIEGEASGSVNGVELAKYGPGDYFGEMSVLDGSPRSATVTATAPLRTVGLTSWGMRSLIKEHPEIAQHVIEVLVARLRATDARFND